jgi:hypothetical protein
MLRVDRISTGDMNEIRRGRRRIGTWRQRADWVLRFVVEEGSENLDAKISNGYWLLFKWN